MDHPTANDQSQVYGTAQASGTHGHPDRFDDRAPGLFLIVKLFLHAFMPKSYGPAGGFAVFTTLIAGVLYIFGFIVAMTFGATAGCSDLADGCSGSRL